MLAGDQSNCTAFTRGKNDVVPLSLFHEVRSKDDVGGLLNPVRQTQDKLLQETDP